MNTPSTLQSQKKSSVLIAIGMIVMILMSLTQLIPSIRIAGFSVFVGLAFFFIVEAVYKTPKSESGIRFRGVFADLKKPGVIIWTLLPVVTAIIPFVIDELFLHMDFKEHVLGRVDGMITFENIALLAVELFVLAMGEEIAWRGFFIGKSMDRFPFWGCAVVSSLLFACGHISDGPLPVLLYDVSFVFIDSMIFAVIYKKSGNCLVSTISHMLGNAVGLAFSLLVI